MEQFQASKQVLWQNQYVLCKMFDSALENLQLQTQVLSHLRFAEIAQYGCNTRPT